MDDKAFIFTLKNPHGVQPTRFMNRNNYFAISCDSNYVPIFGLNILIDANCNRESCLIMNDGTEGYECHPEHKSSLFVNTAGPNETNHFSVLDYEVYTYY